MPLAKQEEGSIQSHTVIDLKEENESKNPDWSNLPYEILEEIQRKLASVDHLRFGGVCRTWRSSRSSYRELRHRHPMRELSWLLMDYLGVWPSIRERTFLCLSEQKKYKLKLWDLFMDRCIGSTGSWLVMQNKDMMALFFQYYLFNPFTKELIWLPKNLLDETMSIAFSTNPADPQSSAVIVPHHRNVSSFVYKKSGSDGWSSYTLEAADRRLKQVVAVGEKFYALTAEGRLVMIDLELDPISIVRHDSVRIQMGRYTHAYLVESTGDLLIVVVYCPRRTGTYDGPHYKLFKFDCGCSRLHYLSNMPSDRLLFVAPNGSFSLSAKEHGVEEAKIYWGTYHFDMFDPRKNACFSCRLDADCFWHVPVWVQPQLFYEERRDFQGRRFLSCRKITRLTCAAMVCASFLFILFLPFLHLGVGTDGLDEF